jgi:hypothetical protein
MMGGASFKSNIGVNMKNEITVKERQELMPSTRAMIYFQVVGIQIIMAAFLFSGENIIHPLLLMIGVVALTKSFEKWRLQNKLK